MWRRETRGGRGIGGKKEKTENMGKKQEVMEK